MMSAAAPGPGTQAKWGQKRRRRRAELMFNGRVSQHSEDILLSIATLRGIQSFGNVGCIKDILIAVVAGFLP